MITSNLGSAATRSIRSMATRVPGKTWERILGNEGQRHTSQVAYRVDHIHRAENALTRESVPAPSE